MPLEKQSSRAEIESDLDDHAEWWDRVPTRIASPIGQGSEVKLQFRGALRTPGDRGPGVPVVLVVDEYHLEILRGNDLIGRWYLAEVEVVRDIAERFVLFLGDDEMEFLAEDALQFAYDGVTAMQNAWLRAQKKKRRHRKAANDAARKKDETPAVVDESLDFAERVERSPQRARPAAQSELARRLGAAAPNAMVKTKDSDQRRRPAEPAEPAEHVPEPVPASTARTASPARPSLSARRKKVVSDAAPEQAEEDTQLTFVSRRLSRAKSETPPVEPAPVASTPRESTSAAPPWIAPEPTTEEPASWAPSVRSTRRRLGQPLEKTGDETAPEVVAGQTINLPIEPVAPVPSAIPQRRARQQPASPPEPDRSYRRGRRLLPSSNGATTPLTEERPPTKREPVQAETAGDIEVRFAPEGHHPAETTTGILSKLRKQPKLPDDHVHKFAETRSAVGLVRRVCVECSYVSIGNDDEGSAITRW